jgi:hypothetical protein
MTYILDRIIKGEEFSTVDVEISLTKYCRDTTFYYIEHYIGKRKMHLIMILLTNYFHALAKSPSAPDQKTK